MQSKDSSDEKLGAIERTLSYVIKTAATRLIFATVVALASLLLSTYYFIQQTINPIHSRIDSLEGAIISSINSIQSDINNSNISGKASAQAIQVLLGKIDERTSSSKQEISDLRIASAAILDEVRQLDKRIAQIENDIGNIEFKMKLDKSNFDYMPQTSPYAKAIRDVSLEDWRVSLTYNQEGGAPSLNISYIDVTQRQILDNIVCLRISGCKYNPTGLTLRAISRTSANLFEISELGAMRVINNLSPFSVWFVVKVQENGAHGAEWLGVATRENGKLEGWVKSSDVVLWSTGVAMLSGPRSLDPVKDVALPVFSNLEDAQEASSNGSATEFAGRSQTSSFDDAPEGMIGVVWSAEPDTDRAGLALPVIDSENLTDQDGSQSTFVRLILPTLQEDNANEAVNHQQGQTEIAMTHLYLNRANLQGNTDRLQQDLIDVWTADVSGGADGLGRSFALILTAREAQLVRRRLQELIDEGEIPLLERSVFFEKLKAASAGATVDNQGRPQSVILEGYIFRALFPILDKIDEGVWLSMSISDRAEIFDRIYAAINQIDEIMSDSSNQNRIARDEFAIPIDMLP